MVHVVDVGHALAYTIDGEQWRARLRSREGRLWPVGGWLDETHRFGPTDSAALMQAVNARPPLPFPQADRVELWLLDPAKLQPLALLHTRNSTTAAGTPLEAILGSHVMLVKGMRFGAGAGAGLTRGLGAPQFRAVLNLEYSPPIDEPLPPTDKDADASADEGMSQDTTDALAGSSEETTASTDGVTNKAD